MKKSLLIALALMLLPVTMIVSSGTAHAAIETEKTLNDRLLTTNQLKEALASNNAKLDIVDSNDMADIKFPELVSSGRGWVTKDDSLLFDMLLSYTDGRTIPASRRDEVLSGTLAKDFMGTFFDKADYLGELEVVSENDIMHGFDATKNGKAYQVASISFIRGNIFGMIFYATADNQLTEVLSAFGGQTAKLPN